MTHELLTDYKIISATRVDWGDMDSFQHVNNTRYFRFFENARIEYGLKIGMMDRLQDEGVGPILAWTECKFIRPLLFPDTALVGLRILSIEDTEMMMDYKVVSERNGIVTAVGKSMGVYYNYRENRREPYPEDLIRRSEEIEGGSIPRKHKA